MESKSSVSREFGIFIPIALVAVLLSLARVVHGDNATSCYCEEPEYPEGYSVPPVLAKARVACKQEGPKIACPSGWCGTYVSKVTEPAYYAGTYQSKGCGGGPKEGCGEPKERVFKVCPPKKNNCPTAEQVDMKSTLKECNCQGNLCNDKDLSLGTSQSFSLFFITSCLVISFSLSFFGSASASSGLSSF